MEQFNWRNKIGLIIGAVVAVCLVIFTFGFGYSLGTQNPKTITIKDISNIENAKIDFGLFWQVWDKLRSEHINGTTTVDQQMVYGAIRGLVASLQDPNTTFFEPSDSKKFEQDINGSFGGIGAELGIRDNTITIIAPLKNTPADKAGLKSGDKIIKINGTSTLDIDINQAVKMIRGVSGTKVTLTIFRDGWQETKDFDIVRSVIQVPTLDVEYIDGIANFKIYSFNANVDRLFYTAMLNSLDKRPRGMILDLRNNPGGYLEQAVSLAGWFLERGKLVVSEHFRSAEPQSFYSPGPSVLSDFPVVILVNGGSASASEILAGALRDQRGIKLVGEKTFGKGTVQEVQPLKDGSTIKITIAKWVMPGGYIIEKEGLVPDYEVKSATDEQLKNKQDPQLEKAIEVIKTLIK